MLPFINIMIILSLIKYTYSYKRGKKENNIKFITQKLVNLFLKRKKIDTPKSLVTVFPWFYYAPLTFPCQSVLFTFLPQKKTDITIHHHCLNNILFPHHSHSSR